MRRRSVARGVTRRARAIVGLVAATAALAAVLAGCGQSSNTTSSGVAGGAPPTSSTPTSATATTSTTSTTTSSAATGSGTLTVSPASGSPGSVIHFAFTSPATTGTQGRDDVSASLSVMGPQEAGCVGVHEQALPSLPAGQQTSVSLGPAQLGGNWCPGTYSARVEVLARPKCGPGMMCPQFIRLVATLGPATFRISG